MLWVVHIESVEVDLPRRLREPRAKDILRREFKNWLLDLHDVFTYD
jgi:hypothetical protein